MTLTKRQEEVLSWYAVGLNAKEIAEHLDLSVHAVHAHTIRLRHALKARTIAHAVYLWYGND
jgi:DNA-binding CsgD family transcriptional regulator